MNVLQKTKVQLCVKRVKDGSDSHVAGRLTGGIVTWPTFQFLCSSPPSCSPCHHLPVYLLFLLLFLKSCTSFSLSLHDALSSRSTAFSCLTPLASLSLECRAGFLVISLSLCVSLFLSLFCTSMLIFNVPLSIGLLLLLLLLLPLSVLKIQTQ